MPVEVRELVVSFAVEEGERRETPAPVLDDGTRRQLVRECVEAVMLALRDQREP